MLFWRPAPRFSLPQPLAPHQIDLIEAPSNQKIFLEGPAGTGKTTTGIERLLFLIASGVPADSILLLVPQRTLAIPYMHALQKPDVVAGGVVTLQTIAGLAQSLVELFWSLIAEQVGFAHPEQPPIFLNLETAQYHMAYIVSPLLDQGYFATVTLHPNRLYSQILDDLNKAAVVDFPHTEIATRLKATLIEPSQARVYDDVQHCANLFREHCLRNNLLDFSLKIEVFRDYLWNLPVVQEYLKRTYRHLIADNIEEDVPITHDLLRQWLPYLDSAWLIYDQQAGYRRFLGADPISAYSLKDRCNRHALFKQSFVTSTKSETFARRLAQAILPETPYASTDFLNEQDVRSMLIFQYHRFHPEMLDWVAKQIASLVHDEGIAPEEIVVLAPYLSDALRFSLTNRLEQVGVPTRSHRPSRALREEPPVHCLLTLAALAHPHWGIHPTRFDVAYALMQAIEDMDLVRARLLSEVVYRTKGGVPTLIPFDRLTNPETRQRITYLLGQRYEGLRDWLEAYQHNPLQELDIFFSRLFGEVLSQPGYGFHRNLDAGQACANLIISARNFRWVFPREAPPGEKPLGRLYLELVRDGIVAGQYLHAWQRKTESAVLLAPAYTFLMSNVAVDVQFWLDVGGYGWAKRLYQPLTHPYVLSRNWVMNTPWTDAHEVQTSQEALQRLILGLMRRCRRKIYLGLSELSEQGYEVRGPLLRALDRVLREATAETNAL